MARTNPDIPGAKGISAFVVEKNSAGVHLGKTDKKMGQKGTHTCDVIFENCRVPAENLIGKKEGQGFKTAMKVLSRQEVSGWLKYQNTAVNHFIDLCELRKKSDLNQAVAICELLASQCEIAGLGKGECFYEMARLNIAKAGISGVPDALGNLIKSGQQSHGYLMRWYPQDEVFKPYRSGLDQELIKVFPKFPFETQPKP